MSTMSLRLPEKLRELAEREGVSMNQFVTTALAEKLSALLTQEYLAERAARGSRSAFEEVLGRVPDVPPAKGDEVVQELSPSDE